MTNLNANLQQLYTRISEVLLLYGMDLLGALAILLIGWWLASRAQHAVERWLSRLRRFDDTLKPFLGALARYVVLALTLIAVLAQFGVETTSIIAVLGAAGLAVGLALQGTLQNIAAGVMLLFLRPFKVGDYIDAEGIAGTVNVIGLFTTDLTTFDGVYRSVPNSNLWNRAILNYSRNPTRRVDVTIGISYSDDAEGALAALLELIRDEPRVLPDPPPQTMVLALADSSVNVNMRCWTKREDYWNLLFDLHRLGKLRLEAAGYTIPFPQRDVHFYPAGAPVGEAMPASQASRAAGT